jgi:hypothetical protein
VREVDVVQLLPIRGLRSKLEPAVYVSVYATASIAFRPLPNLAIAPGLPQ